MHRSSQLLHKLSFDPKKRLEIFTSLPPEKQASVLLKLTKRVQCDIVRQLSRDALVTMLEHFDPDEATDVLQLLPRARRTKIISKLKRELQESVSFLQSFDPKTAAGLMNIDYIQVEQTDTVAEVSRQFRVHERRTGRLPAIIVLDDGNLIGYLPGHQLGFGKASDNIKKYTRKIQTIHHKATHEQVTHVFKEHPHNKVAVLGDRGNVLGIIYSDDILKFLQEKESESLYHFAGVHHEEGVTDTVMFKVKSRYRWLIINLATGFLAAFTVSLFEETLSKYVLLAFYMPIVAGMGGNSATQTLAVLVRGITLQHIEFKTAWITLRREVGASLINGLINGFLVAGIVLFVHKDSRLAFVLATAMIVNLLVAGVFGTIVPLIMQKLGKDPATSATIFITTATDVLGFMAFLGLATVALG